ncbi:F-BAR domain only protein 2 isoform X4 [Zootermopsis nevadensis]|uniref:F-BAR domain only protein 2 isoform X4 n=1 Tax=Zootermopsis nevadensis TaxID=136037 RepID=UPI000B8E406F|nr:F-BAR domain only protein 2 isoform X4 [Zootermopsis nevadensis]
MTVDFSDYFWGEKNNGFDVLYHNMKHGLVASKEFADFLRERSSIEENHSKLLSKLAKQAAGGCVQGTFAPLWHVLRTSAEKLANLHMQMVQKVSELVKEVSRYADELHKKHKTVKEEESGTLEIVQAIQSTTLTLQKAKDAYTQKGLEFDKLKKENASAKDVEKAEAKLKKAQEDYKNLIDKYSAVKEDFEKKMSVACKHFQDVEEAHVKQMKEFLNTYAEVLQNNHDLIGQVHIEFKQQCLEMTVDKLLEQFVSNKCTGLEKPGSIEFEELNMSGLTSISNQTPDSSDKTANGDKPSKKEGNLESGGQKTKESKTSRRTTSLLNLFMSNSQGSKECSGNPEGGSLPTSAPTSPTSGVGAGAGTGIPPNGNATSLARNPLRGSKWFLRSRREKRKEKKAKKKKDGLDNTSSKDDKSDVKPASLDDSREDKDDSRKSGTPTPEVDEEGYCIRPKVDLWGNEKGSFYSSSDTDSDDEREHKIHVEIKPLSNGSAPMSASVDELRATVENLSLSPVAMASGRRDSGAESDHHMKRSQSVSQQLGGKPSSDLLGLSLFQSPTASSASTPTGVPSGGHPYAPLQSPTQPSMGSPAPSSSSRYADLGDLFSEVGEIQPALPPKQSRQTPTPTQGSIAIPRPPSRRGEGPSPRGRMSPAPGSSSISRADSVGSLEFRTAGIPVGSSRGPSPLTIGMADTIPLAVAFHEIVHSYFKGTDETKCQVKLSGDMMLSFPAGIVAVLANNPSPAQLSFRIRNIHRLDNVLPNKQLVTLDSAQSSNESMLFDFNMSALTALLRRQSEQNPSASYFNVDILKYQVKPKSGAGSCPYQLVAYWKCESGHTDLRVDYKYNSHAMASASPLLNLTVAVPIDGGVKSMQSKPAAQWLADSHRAVWKFTELSQHSENHGVGSLRARLEVSNGPSSQGTIATQFNCEGTTLSGVEFDLVGTGYRLSLVKRRFVSGKYICDADPDPKYRYAAPPSSDC